MDNWSEHILDLTLQSSVSIDVEMGAYNLAEVLFEVPLNLLEKDLRRTWPHGGEAFDVMNLHRIWIIVR